MRRIRPITAARAKASDVAPEVKLQFLVDLLTVSLPLFVNKDAQNPAPGNGTDD